MDKFSHSLQMWHEITYSFPNVNVAAVEVWEWMNNFFPHFTEHVITYRCWDLSETMIAKGTTEL